MNCEVFFSSTGVSRTISNSTSTCCDIVIDLDDNSTEDVIILDEVKNSDDNINEDVIVLDEIGPSNDDVELLPAENINFESSVVVTDIEVDPSPLENIMAEPSHAEDVVVKQLSVNDITDDTSSGVGIVVEQSIVENIEVEPSPTVDIITEQLTVDDITNDTSSATNITVEPSVVGNIELESSPVEPAFEDDIMIELSSDEETVDVPNEDGVVRSSEMSKNRIDLPETVAKSRENFNELMCELSQHRANEDGHMECSNQAIRFDNFKFVFVIYYGTEAEIRLQLKRFPEIPVSLP